MAAFLACPETAQMPSNIEFQVIALPTVDGFTCQTLVFNLLRPLEPDALAQLSLPADLDLTQGVLIFGAGPSWLYGCLITRCHAAPWVATYHLRLRCGVVVASQVTNLTPGDRLPMQFSAEPGAAILVGGPPNSGKSVFSHALNRDLIQQRPRLRTHLFRANWDGEGNHTQETTDPVKLEQLRRENNPKLQHQANSAEKIAQFFQKKGQEIPNIRPVMDLTLVDIGGQTGRDRLPVVEACTHSIIISSDPDKIAAWRELCEPALQPLAVIHSVLEPRCEVIRTEPFLEIVAGPWVRGQNPQVPKVLVDRVLSVLA